MSTDDQAAATLAESACWAKLRLTTVGRLATCLNGVPEVVPINFVVDHSTIVFRTAGGTKFTAITSGKAVAFETDGYEPETGDAWSVVVKGTADPITRPSDLVVTTELPLHPWHPTAKGHFVRIVVREMTGRQFHVTTRDTWLTPVTGSPHSADE